MKSDAHLNSGPSLESHLSPLTVERWIFLGLAASTPKIWAWKERAID
uniref:Uncharacterized protein n=1 Tax=Anguilla anguilla TaxID=7936 RepID=A0A0E9RUE9_ANGAN